MITIFIEDTNTKIKFTRHVITKNERDRDNYISIAITTNSGEKETYKINVQQCFITDRSNPIKRSDFSHFENGDKIFNVILSLYGQAPYLDYEIRYNIVSLLDAIVLHELDLFGNFDNDIKYLLTHNMRLIIYDTRMDRFLKLGNNEKESKYNIIQKYVNFIRMNRLIN